MIERLADAWERNQFKDVIARIANVEIYYKALAFYLRSSHLVHVPSHRRNFLHQLPTCRSDIILPSRLHPSHWGLFHRHS